MLILSVICYREGNQLTHGVVAQSLKEVLLSIEAFCFIPSQEASVQHQWGTAGVRSECSLSLTVMCFKK